VWEGVVRQEWRRPWKIEIQMQEKAMKRQWEGVGEV
jgi:hypothetical protein